MNNIISQAKKYNSFYIFAFVLLGLAVIIVPNSEGIGNYLFIGAAIFSTIASEANVTNKIIALDICLMLLERNLHMIVDSIKY